MQAGDRSGAFSGLQQRGAFTVVPDHSPVPLAVNPSSGKGYRKTFRLDLFDENGYADLSRVYMDVEGNGYCWIDYYPLSKLISIYSGGTDRQTGRIGAEGTIQTGNCTMNTGASTASGSGMLLTLNLAITFKAGWEGEKNVTLFAMDSGCRNWSGTRGKWVVGPNPVITSGDFNGDGKPDIVWHSSSTGEIAVWLMDGTGKSSYATVGYVSDRNWSIVGIADFNADSKSDILWRNKSTGENCVWYMDGTTKNSDVCLDTAADLNWTITGVADFNSDDKPDILWRNSLTGENYVWFMNGTSRVDGAHLTTVPDANWKIAGLGDFNNDGKPDILWRNRSTGENYVWFMNGATGTGGAYLDSVPNLNWKIAAVADFNKDGRVAILWRDSTTGENYIWYMNGIAHTGGDYLTPVGGQGWKVAPASE